MLPLLLLMLTPSHWLSVWLAKNWVPPLTLTPLWLPSLFLLLDLAGCVWRILMCHCTSARNQLPLVSLRFSTFSQQHHSPIPRPKSLGTCERCPLRRCPLREGVLALLSALPHASDWLNGVPSTTLGLHVQDQKLRSCLHYLLGVSLHCSSYSCPEYLNTADPFGDHHVGCGGNRDRIIRRNAIWDVIFIVLPNLLPWLLLRRCPT